MKAKTCGVHGEWLEERAGSVLANGLWLGKLLPGDDEGQGLILLHKILGLGLLAGLVVLIVRKQGLHGALNLILCHCRHLLLTSSLPMNESTN